MSVIESSLEKDQCRVDAAASERYSFAAPLQAAEFLADAAQDEFTQFFPDPASADGVIGFHAQQAGEKMKMLNAVLALRSVSYRPTHTIAALLDHLREHRASFPAGFQDIPLTPFAG
jgi:hypothetical protein